MKKSLLYVCLASMLHAVPAAAQFVVTQPSTQTNVKAADDFATTAFQDPWDMSQRTDVGWWLFGSDFPPSNWTSPTFSGGVFTGTTAGAGARLFLLESGLAPTLGGSATPIGKTGQQFPINANKYTHLLYRMSSPTGFQDTANTSNLSQFIWSTNTIYDDQTVAASKEVIKGNAVYDVDLRTLPVGGSTWNGVKRSFQFLPNQVTGALIQLDWVRLVDGSDATLFKNITWTGGTADIYLDNDNSAANGNLGRIALNAAGGTFNFFIGGLQPGDYYVAVGPHTVGAVSAGLAYSAGFYRVNTIPTLTFTTPSDEGSSEDFATTRLGDAWDFTSMSDIDSTLPGFPGKVNVTNDGIAQVNLTSEAGVNLGAQTVYLGSSTQATQQSGNVGDPQIYTLFWDGKGKVNQIDPSRYRILTIEAGIPNMARSLPTGSVGRVIWRALNEPMTDTLGIKVRTVSEQWALNSAAGENTLAHYTIDMNKMPVEPGSADTSTTWNSGIAAGGIDAFRFDPHEFSPPTQFFIKKIKLAALERTVGDSFTFRWNYSGAGTVTLFRQASTAAKNFTAGVQIAGPVSGATGSATWNATGAANGEYQVYAVFTDGTNTNQVYAPTNVIVDHSNIAVKQITLNRTQLNFAILGPVRTSAQTVRLTFSGTGDECWQSTSNAGSLISVTPASGVGATAISIAPAAAANFPGGTTNVVVNIRSCTNPAITRAIAIAVTGYNATGGPTGSLDTPANGSIAQGSVAVTGWAADDLEVVRVAICRGPSAGEQTTPSLCGGQSQVFIGDAAFVDDARPDVQGSFTSAPYNYRAGWGYLMLTNFLPNQGNGPVTLSVWATDREGFQLGLPGHTTLIGSKTINTQNATATRPFGAIDTPGQGEVICGTQYINFGWALTQNGKDVPANSSTITVFIDNLPVGHPGARLARPDITAAFPTNNGTSHAAGGLVLDTTAFANGIHTIAWSVTDTGGQNDGIGSRFFSISNPCSGS
jgi:hypothetical protein